MAAGWQIERNSIVPGYSSPGLNSLRFHVEILVLMSLIKGRDSLFLKFSPMLREHRRA